MKPTSRPTVVNKGKVDISHVSSRLTECLAVIEEKQEIRVGDRVRVTGLVQVASGNQLLQQSHAAGLGHYAKGMSECDGTVRFVGTVDFVEDENKWYGVELDQPIGRHDGTVQGVRYFAAADNTGVFVTEAKLSKIVVGDTRTRRRSGMAASRESLDALLIDDAEVGSFSGNFHNLGQDPVVSENGGRTSLSMRHRVSKVWQPAFIQMSESHKGSRFFQSSSFAASDYRQFAAPQMPTRSASRMSTMSRATVISRRPSQLAGDPSAAEDGWKTVSAEQYNKFKKKVAKKFLDVGTSAICIHTKVRGLNCSLLYMLLTVS